MSRHFPPPSSIPAGRVDRASRGFAAAGSGRSAFSFVELMFAMTILGIGFIMLAAMFPVAIQQTQITLDETAAANVAGAAVQYLSQTLSDADVSAGDTSIQDVHDLLPGAASHVGGNVVATADPRYAWVGLVRRMGGESPLAQVWVFVVRARNQDRYAAGRDTQPVGEGPAALEARTARVTLDRDTSGAPFLRFADPPESTPFVASGAFMVVKKGGGIQGHILRLGSVRDSSANTWELAPGWDAGAGTGGGASLTVCMVGRGYADPAHPEAGYEGPTQDVAIYTTVISLH